MVEDDLLAEIYLERENEYTLAGSIYKGRVTRVLPGMQSAFVDIGLERDAFLYVSDFMELEDSEDLDEVPTNRPVLERHQPQPHAEAPNGETFARPRGDGIATPGATLEAGTENQEAPAPGESRDNRGGFRGRRRRRGRRGERMPESKFANPATEAPREAPRTERPERNDRPERNERPVRSEASDRGGRFDRPSRTERPEHSEYGPPPGYQPMILPGESISKYSRMATSPSRPAPASERPAVRLKSRLRSRWRKFLPTMNQSLRQPLLRPLWLRLKRSRTFTKRRRRCITNRRLKIHRAPGTASNSACTR